MGLFAYYHTPICVQPLNTVLARCCNTDIYNDQDLLAESKNHQNLAHTCVYPSQHRQGVSVPKSMNRVGYDAAENSIWYQTGMHELCACDWRRDMLFQPMLHSAFLICVPVGCNDRLDQQHLCSKMGIRNMLMPFLVLNTTANTEHRICQEDNNSQPMQVSKQHQGVL